MCRRVLCAIEKRCVQAFQRVYNPQGYCRLTVYGDFVASVVGIVTGQPKRHTVSDQRWNDQFIVVHRPLPVPHELKFNDLGEELFWCPVMYPGTDEWVRIIHANGSVYDKVRHLVCCVVPFRVLSALQKGNRC